MPMGITEAVEGLRSALRAWAGLGIDLCATHIHADGDVHPEHCPYCAAQKAAVAALEAAAALGLPEALASPEAAASAMKEACALIADERAAEWRGTDDGRARTAEAIAYAIRNR